MRQVEIFSAGCVLCKETIDLVNRVAGPSSKVTVLDMNERAVANRAKQLGIRSVPAVAIDGKLADCCQHGDPNEEMLKDAGRDA